MSDIAVRQLTGITPAIVDRFNELLPQLSQTAEPLAWATLHNLVHDPRVRLFVAESPERIVGFLVLHIPNQISPGKGWLEDLVVDMPYRRRGVGRMLMLAAIEEAHRIGLKSLNATTSRPASQALTTNLGFELRRSMLVRLDLRSGGPS